MSTLAEIAEASVDPVFRGRIMAGMAVLGLPQQDSYFLQVAANVDLSGGTAAVPDEAILLALNPPSLEAPIDPDPDPMPEAIPGPQASDPDSYYVPEP